ncbi:MAG: hypothetical protein ACRC5C_11285 [Bacilli bacterium]
MLNENRIKFILLGILSVYCGLFLLCRYIIFDIEPSVESKLSALEIALTDQRWEQCEHEIQDLNLRFEEGDWLLYIHFGEEAVYDFHFLLAQLEELILLKNKPEALLLLVQVRSYYRNEFTH